MKRACDRNHRQRDQLIGLRVRDRRHAVRAHCRSPMPKGAQQEKEPVKTFAKVLGLASLIALAACGSKEENRIENAYDNQADALDNQAANMEALADNLSGTAEDAAENAADALENKADAVRDAGDNAADAVAN